MFAKNIDKKVNDIDSINKIYF